MNEFPEAVIVIIGESRCFLCGSGYFSFVEGPSGLVSFGIVGIKDAINGRASIRGAYSSGYGNAPSRQIVSVINRSAFGEEAITEVTVPIVDVGGNDVLFPLPDTLQGDGAYLTPETLKTVETGPVVREIGTLSLILCISLDIKGRVMIGKISLFIEFSGGYP